MKNYDLVCIGEVLIDFTPAGSSRQGQALFECNPGGSVCNVAVAASCLGGKSAFIGKVGNDMFGRYLKETIAQKGVDVSGMILSDEYPTTLAFVKLYENGERDFSFYRKNCADTMLEPSEVPIGLLEHTKAVQSSSLPFTGEKSAEAVLKAFECGRRNGAWIAYDVNWRAPLWQSIQEGIEGIRTPLRYVDIIKVSQEELELISGITNEEKAVQALLDQGIQLVLLTKGTSGSQAFMDKRYASMPAFKVDAVDATGAGDAFLGAAVLELLKLDKPFQTITEKDLANVLKNANAVAALSVVKRGAIPAMPSQKELAEFLSSLRQM